MNCRKARAGKDRLVVTVSSSSKKAGKSSLAAMLVRELPADYGLKVSAGGTHGGDDPIISDPEVISQPDTDTGALVDAGAKIVLWVNANAKSLEDALERALNMFPPGGVLVVEGNSALEYLSPDFSVFLMNVTFEDFKPSAHLALSRSDLVLVDSGGSLGSMDTSSLEESIRSRAKDAKITVYGDDSGRYRAWEEAVRLAGQILVSRRG